MVYEEGRVEGYESRGLKVTLVLTCTNSKYGPPEQSLEAQFGEEEPLAH